MARSARERGLKTLLFTDIVGSSDIAAELGDRRWRALQARHHAEVRRRLKQHRGREVDTAGDGFFATFDSPEMGARCAASIVRGVRTLGLDVRAGLHHGEVELTGEKSVGGLAVTVAARVSALASSGGVVATDTVVHLVIGSGLRFDERGTQELRGVPGTWRLYRLAAVDGERIGDPLLPEEAAEIRLRATSTESPRRSTRSRASIGVAVAAAIAVLVTGALVLGSRGSASPSSPPSSQAAVRAPVTVYSESGGSVPPIAVQGASAGAITTTPGFVWVVVAETSVTARTSARWIEKVNPQTSQVVYRHPLSASYPVLDLASDGGNVWFVTPAGGRTLAQSIGAKTNEPRDPLRVSAEASAGGTVPGIAWGDGSLWIGDNVNSRVYRLNPTTGQRWTYAIPGSVDDIAFGDGALWVVDTGDGKITRIDPRTEHTVPDVLDSYASLGDIAVGGGYVWVTDQTNNAVWRVSSDLASKTQISVGSRPDDVSYGDGAAWVANFGDDTISKIDPVVGQQVGNFPVTVDPRSVAAIDGEIWVAGDIPGTDFS